MDKDVILKIKDLSKSFEKQQVLSELNLEMSEGEFLTLLGPSGCGKTTLLNCIAGFVRPDKGSIYLRGKKVNDVKTKDRNLSMVFQSWALFPHMNVFDNIAFGLRMKGFTKKDIEKKVKKSLDLIKLSDISHKYPSQLSGGMQQRVALARAI
ncbi:MAG: ABC transporter ATP-binding protein, partial [Candidatus Heimdallarchaeaceae archaeon]